MFLYRKKNLPFGLSLRRFMCHSSIKRLIKMCLCLGLSFHLSIYLSKPKSQNLKLQVETIPLADLCLNRDKKIILKKKKKTSLIPTPTSTLFIRYCIPFTNTGLKESVSHDNIYYFLFCNWER